MSSLGKLTAKILEKLIKIRQYQFTSIAILFADFCRWQPDRQIF